ncbi:hypothetical protein C9374_005438 [Naegleria lovaniensis]|uniref:Actin-related protein 6 n=1 Tax=Naegleria lovaniensis TaxID=51637 RepID=A0AA88KN68_NAELO|nr:uncharacterized protein C9374_005438 [Naegleria lovaniensis]KAG2382236.1 hypothetical protein C9374_005438 [Naegleria lovaniensis]
MTSQGVLQQDYISTSSSAQTLIMDNGGDTIKIGLAPNSLNDVLDQASELKRPLIIPNTIAKQKASSSTSGSVFIGDQLESDCECFASLLFRRPIERGYVVDCETQAMIWDYLFKTRFSSLPISETRLFLSHQPCTPKTIQKDLCQLIFEYFGFKEYASLSSQYLSFFGYLNEISDEKSPLYSVDTTNPVKLSKSALVVDSGFSFTHIYPIINSLPVKTGIQRIDIGGKLLTNYLKEVVSTRYYDMMEETYLMNLVKERLCYVSKNFLEDLHAASFSDSPLFQSYVLPDYRHSKTGYLLDTSNMTSIDPELQILTLNNERIAIPELLFNPSDIGLNQAGIAETCARTILTNIKSPVEQSILFDAILITGGNTKFKHFKERLVQEIRPFCPEDFKSVTVLESKNPITLCWRGASAFSFYQKRQLDQCTVKKEEYEEAGYELCEDRFKQS